MYIAGQNFIRYIKSRAFAELLSVNSKREKKSFAAEGSEN